MEIKVKQKTNQEFLVTVEDEQGVEDYLVFLEPEYHETLSSEPALDFIKRCFEFLLKRESKEKILQSFNIKEIQEFFPEFEKTIQQ